MHGRTLRQLSLASIQLLEASVLIEEHGYHILDSVQEWKGNTETLMIINNYFCNRCQRAQ